MALREDLGYFHGISAPAFTASACLLGLIKEVYKAFLLSIASWTPGLYAKKNRNEPNSISMAAPGTADVVTSAQCPV